MNRPLLVGSDLGGKLGMIDEMKIWEKLGVSRYTILKSATYQPALFLNKSTQWGTVEMGKEASLLILDKNPLEGMDNLKSIDQIILQGRLLKK